MIGKLIRRKSARRPIRQSDGILFRENEADVGTKK